jgi:hypothetical protein
LNLQILEVVTKILQNIAIIVGIVVSYLTYVQHNEQVTIEQKRFTEATIREFKGQFYSRRHVLQTWLNDIERKEYN